MRVVQLALLVLLVGCHLGLKPRSLATESELSAMPDFTGKDAHGQNFRLGQALENGPVLVIFYRGHW